MQPARPRRLPYLLASTMLVLGLALLGFMVTVEGEPGALPLLLILTSIAWLIVLRRRPRSA